MNDKPRIITPFSGAQHADATKSSRVSHLAANQDQMLKALALYSTAFSAFMGLNLFGRLKWLIYGAKAFAPKAKKDTK